MDTWAQNMLTENLHNPMIQANCQKLNIFSKKSSIAIETSEQLVSSNDWRYIN